VATATEKPAACRPGETKPSSVRRDLPAPPPPDLLRHVERLALDEVWGQLNRQRLYSKYFGLKGTLRKLAEAGDDTLAKDEVVAEWTLPRQESGERLCLADYVLPGDHVALFVTTAGKGVRERAEGWKERGEYLKSHGWAALALETAEAAAEWLHMRLRAAW